MIPEECRSKARFAVRQEATKARRVEKSGQFSISVSRISGCPMIETRQLYGTLASRRSGPVIGWSSNDPLAPGATGAAELRRVELLSRVDEVWQASSQTNWGSGAAISIHSLTSGVLVVEEASGAGVVESGAIGEVSDGCDTDDAGSTGTASVLSCGARMISLSVRTNAEAEIDGYCTVVVALDNPGSPTSRPRSVSWAVEPVSVTGMLATSISKEAILGGRGCLEPKALSKNVESSYMAIAGHWRQMQWNRRYTLHLWGSFYSSCNGWKLRGLCFQE